MNREKYINENINESALLCNGACGYFRLTKGAFNYHRQIELVYVKRGEVTALMGTGKMHLRQGCLAIIKPNELHTFEGTINNKCICPILPDEYSNRLSQRNIKNCVIKDNTGDIEKILSMYPKFDKLSPEGRMMYFLMVYNLIDKKLAQDNGVSEKLEDRIIDYIQENFEEHITINSVAEVCTTNRNYVSSAVNKHTNMNFNTYLNSLRLSRFIVLYDSNDLSIADAAERAGFESARTFYRSFRQEYSMSPSSYFEMLNNSRQTK